MMKKLNPKNYDYLWTDYDVNFVFVSCYLFKEFRESNFVLIFNWKNKRLKFFLSKKDRKKLPNYGVVSYKKYFQNGKLIY
jgi:hypothetical protein